VPGTVGRAPTDDHRRAHRYRSGVSVSKPPAGAVAPELRDAILAWFEATGRQLAFRATTDPWAILVSEAMAQQTQAARAAEAWGRFLAEFPTAEALAAATPAASCSSTRRRRKCFGALGTRSSVNQWIASFRDAFG